jgi:hypothetical protein
MKDEKKKKPTESIKVFKEGLDKVRETVEKTGQTITAFYSLAAEEKLKSDKK